MKTFEQKKEEYLEKLKEEPELIGNLVFNNNKTEMGQRTLELLFTPKNERELQVAEIIFSITKDMTDLLENISYDEVVVPPYDENEGLKTYIKMIRSLKETGSIESAELDEKPNPKKEARVMYDFIVAIMDDSDEAVDYIAKSTGFDLEDVVEGAQFKVYMDKCQAIMDERNNYKNRDIEDLSDYELLYGKEYSLEFHELCKCGKKDYKKEEKHKKLFKK